MSDGALYLLVCGFVENQDRFLPVYRPIFAKHWSRHRDRKESQTIHVSGWFGVTLVEQWYGLESESFSTENDRSFGVMFEYGLVKYKMIAYK